MTVMESGVKTWCMFVGISPSSKTGLHIVRRGGVLCAGDGVGPLTAGDAGVEGPAVDSMTFKLCLAFQVVTSFDKASPFDAGSESRTGAGSLDMRAGSLRHANF